MAYDVNKLVKLQGLKDLATQVKTELAALSTRIDDIVSTGGEPNVITSVKVNGTALAIAEKAVNILIATGTANGTLAVNGVDVAIKGLAALAYKAQVSQADLDAALQAVLGNVTTLVGSDAGKSARTIPTRSWLRSSSRRAPRTAWTRCRRSPPGSRSIPTTPAP